MFDKNDWYLNGFPAGVFCCFRCRWNSPGWWARFDNILWLEVMEKIDTLEHELKPPKNITGWWFQTFFIFTPIWGKYPYWTNIFQMGWNHQKHKICWDTKVDPVGEANVTCICSEWASSQCEDLLVYSMFWTNKFTITTNLTVDCTC